MKQKIKALIPLSICLTASLLIWLFILTGVIGEKENWRVIFSTLGLAGILSITIWITKKLYNKI
jgi:hypothetical protein